MYINVSENRNVYFDVVGTQNENRTDTIKIKVPEKYEEFNKHYNFEQFENVREVIFDKVSDFIENADVYDLFLLEWKLENLKRKK